MQGEPLFFVCMYVRPSHPFATIQCCFVFITHYPGFVHAAMPPANCCITYVHTITVLASSAFLQPAGTRCVSHISQVSVSSIHNLPLSILPDRGAQSTATSRTYLRTNSSTPYCSLDTPWRVTRGGVPLYVPVLVVRTYWNRGCRGEPTSKRWVSCLAASLFLYQY